MPATQPTSPPPQPPPGKPAAEEEEDTNGVFGPLRLGPYVGTGLPNVLNFGGTAKFFDYLGFGINFGMIPDIKVSYYGDATLKYREYDAYGRLYLFGGSFFVGAGVGYHSAEGTFVKAIPSTLPGVPTEVTSHGSVKAMILTPQIGWFSVFGSGFALGIDVGGQIPIAPSKVSYQTDLPALPASVPATVQAQIQQVVDQSNKPVIDTLEKIGKTPLPVFNLRLGYLF
jgi:hypothetical protein